MAGESKISIQSIPTLFLTWHPNFFAIALAIPCGNFYKSIMNIVLSICSYFLSIFISTSICIYLSDCFSERAIIFANHMGLGETCSLVLMHLNAVLGETNIGSATVETPDAFL